LGHILIDNRNDLIGDVQITRASSAAEREAALTATVELPECALDGSFSPISTHCKNLHS
jgi:hypothetical protein